MEGILVKVEEIRRIAKEIQAELELYESCPEVAMMRTYMEGIVDRAYNTLTDTYGAKLTRRLDVTSSEDG